MDQSEIDKLREEAKTVMSGKELDEAMKAFELLEKSNRELMSNGVNIDELNKINKTTHINEHESLQSLKKSYTLMHEQRKEKDKLLDKVSAKHQEENKLIKSIRSNFKNPEYVKRIKKIFYWRKSLFQLSVLAMLVSSVFLFTFLKEQNISEESATIIFVLIFGVTYFSLGYLLWRCPACNYKLDFSSKFKGKKFNTSSVKKCPRCYAQL